MKTKTLAALLLMACLTACTGSKINTQQLVAQVETAALNAASSELARQTVSNIGTRIGLSTQQSAQILPMLTQYYTQVATTIKNTPGNTANEKLKNLKNDLLAQLKTVLTTGQVGKIKDLI